MCIEKCSLVVSSTTELQLKVGLAIINFNFNYLMIMEFILQLKILTLYYMSLYRKLYQQFCKAET